MSGNTFGKLFTVTTFGESHGLALGAIVDGCPPGMALTEADLQLDLDRRKPGTSRHTTQRREADQVKILSGVFEGKTTGTPIGLLIENTDQRSKDYGKIQEQFRPSHADFTYQQKYGIRDHRGGGRSSARETLSRVVGGAVAKLWLRQMNVDIIAYSSQVGEIALEHDYTKYDLSLIEETPVRCPDPEKAEEMIKLINEVRYQGDTIGGIITCVIKGVPVGLGEPVFGKLHAALGSAMLGINAVKGFEYGTGFNVSQRGSEVNDVFYNDKGIISTRTNRSGGDRKSV